MRPRDLLGQRDHPTRILDDLLAFYANLRTYNTDEVIDLQVLINDDLIDEDRIRHYIDIDLLEIDANNDLRLAPLGIALLGPFAHPRIIDHCTDWLDNLANDYDSGISSPPMTRADAELEARDAENIRQISILIRDGQPQEAVKVYNKLDTGVREGIDDHLLLVLLFWFDPEA